MCVCFVFIGTMFSVGVFSHMLKIDDSLVGLMSCMSKILSGFIYAFASTEFVFYLGKSRCFVLYHANRISIENYKDSVILKLLWNGGGVLKRGNHIYTNTA